MPTSASNFSGVWQSLQPPMVTSEASPFHLGDLVRLRLWGWLPASRRGGEAAVRANPIVSRCVRFVMVSSVVESFVSRSPTNGVARTTMAKPRGPDC